MERLPRFGKRGTSKTPRFYPPGRLLVAMGGSAAIATLRENDFKHLAFGVDNRGGLLRWLQLYITVADEITIKPFRTND